MEDKKISELGRTTALQGDEIVPFAKGGDNGAFSMNTAKTFMQNGMVKEVSGKGLSTNDYTTEDRQKLSALPTSTELADSLKGKVDAVKGMGLSTNDYTGADKAKLGALPTKADLIADLGKKVDAVSGKGLSTNDYTTEDKQKLAALPTNEKLTEDLADAKLALFIDQWNSACGSFGKYNPQTGFFELNGLTDITYEEAVAIFEQSKTIAPNISSIGNTRTNIFIKGLLPSPTQFNTTPNIFYNANRLEVIRVSTDDGRAKFVSRQNIFNSDTKLKAVLGVIDITESENTPHGMFHSCVSLENLRIIINQSFDIRYCPKISLASLQYLVANAANTSAITVTVHADVYAKLTDETNTEWNQVLTDATAKNIQFATA